MSLKLITAPTEPAVSLAELKSHIQNAADEQDADLQLKLDAAIEYVEGETRRALVTSTWDLYLDRWPDRGCLDVPLGNLQSVTHIKYTDSAGALSTVSAADYKLARTYTPYAAGPPEVLGDGATDAGIGRIYLAYNAQWPTATLDTGEPIVVRFTAGWDAASVPKPIKQAVLMLASHWARNRDAVVVGNTSAVVSSELALGVARLLGRFEDRRW
jgi:uncharacterized phiE125 gp8 family phage protein